MSNTEAASAWKFLQRNPAYREARRRWAAPAPVEAAPFPLRRQTEGDLEAALWGLLAWEDPLDEAGPAAPFWTEAPTLEAMPMPGAPTLAELSGEAGQLPGGLRKVGGAGQAQAAPLEGGGPGRRRPGRPAPRGAGGTAVPGHPAARPQRRLERMDMGDPRPRHRRLRGRGDADGRGGGLRAGGPTAVAKPGSESVKERGKGSVSTCRRKRPEYCACRR